VQLLTCDLSRIVEGEFSGLSVRKCECASKEGKLVECEAQSVTESLYGRFGVIQIRKLRITSISVNTAYVSK
jgi:hypothetical protein